MSEKLDKKTVVAKLLHALYADRSGLWHVSSDMSEAIGCFRDMNWIN